MTLIEAVVVLFEAAKMQFRVNIPIGRPEAYL
jgi:hypothetical protein